MNLPYFILLQYRKNIFFGTMTVDKLVHFRHKSKEQFFIDTIGMSYFVLGAIIGFGIPEAMVIRIIGIVIGAQIGLTFGFMIGYSIIGGRPDRFRELSTCLDRVLVAGVCFGALYFVLYSGLTGIPISYVTVLLGSIFGAITFFVTYKMSFSLAIEG